MVLHSLPELDNFDAVIFDLGEVIIDLDPAAVVEKFSAHLDPKRKGVVSELIVKSNALYEFETGKMDEETFISNVNDVLDINLDREEFISIWNSMLLPIKEERIQMLENLKKSHRVFFLSNTNQIHQGKFDEMIREAGTYEKLSEVVEEAIYSHVVGMRKPEKEIYTYIIDVIGTNPEKVLFLDDKEENIVAASQMGINGMIVRNASALPEMFEERIV